MTVNPMTSAILKTMGIEIRRLVIFLTVLTSQQVFAETSYRRYCDILLNQRNNFDVGSEEYNSLATDHKSLCTGAAVDGFQGDDQWAKPYTGPQNQFIGAAPDHLEKPTETQQVLSTKMEQADSNLAQIYKNCRTFAVRVESECMSALGASKAQYSGEYQRLMGLMGQGTKTAVAQACNSVSGFSSTASSALSSGVQSCDQFRVQCEAACNSAETATLSQNGFAKLNEWMKLDFSDGWKACNNIKALVIKAKDDSLRSAQNLSNECATAQNALQADQDKQASKDEEKEDDKETNKRNQALGNALQSLGSLLTDQGDVAPNMGFPMPPSPVPTLPNYEPSGSVNYPNATKDMNSSASSPVGSGGGGLTLGDEGLGGPTGYQKSQMGQNPQNGGGGGAGVGSQGGGNAAAGKTPPRRGRSGFDTDIYKGAFSGTSGGGKGTGGDGYPKEGNAKGQRAGPPGRFANGQTMTASQVQLHRFLPTWHVRRHVANSVGPDGITGPHSDQFKKIRIRYEAVPLNYEF